MNGENPAMPSAEENFKTLVTGLGMDWRDHAARFNVVVHTSDEQREVMQAQRDADAGKVTHEATDLVYALVTHDIRQNVNPFALDAQGNLKDPQNLIHSPQISDELRGLYLITRSTEEQLAKLRETLGNGMVVEKRGVGDDCVELGAATTCRYVAKLAPQR